MQGIPLDNTRSIARNCHVWGISHSNKEEIQVPVSHVLQTLRASILSNKCGKFWKFGVSDYEIPIEKLEFIKNH